MTCHTLVILGSLFVYLLADIFEINLMTLKISIALEINLISYKNSGFFDILMKYALK
jgi:hypothetical protein